jgi:hypothetical protein
MICYRATIERHRIRTPSLRQSEARSPIALFDAHTVAVSVKAWDCDPRQLPVEVYVVAPAI